MCVDSEVRYIDLGATQLRKRSKAEAAAEFKYLLASFYGNTVKAYIREDSLG